MITLHLPPGVDVGGVLDRDRADREHRTEPKTETDRQTGVYIYLPRVDEGGVLDTKERQRQSRQ